MTTTTLVERRDALLETIVSEHLREELPGETETIQFARDVTLSALLGRIVTTPAPAPLAETTALSIPVVMPAAPALTPAPTPPDSPVETLPEDSPPSEDVAPGVAASGETSEEVRVGLPPVSSQPDETATIVENLAPPLPHLACPPSEHPAYHQVLQIALSRARELLSGARGTFNAFCTAASKATGLSEIAVRPLCIQAHRAIKVEDTVQFTSSFVNSPEIGRPKPAAPVADVSITYASDEAEQVPVKGLHTPDPDKTRQKSPSGQPQPPWWTESAVRQCRTCGGIIPPRRFEKTRGWESPSMYSQRRTCGRVCPSQDPMPPFRPT